MTQAVRRAPAGVDPRLARTLRRFLAVIAAVTMGHAVACAGLGVLAWRSSIGDRQDATLVERLYLAGSVADVIRLLLIVITGLLWFVWQVGVARVAERLRPGHLRRRPAMHVVDWFIPVVGLWFPNQDVRDLTAALPGRTGDKSLAIGAWWVAWVTSAVLLWTRPLTGLAASNALGWGALVGVELDIMVVSALDVLADAALVVAAVHARLIVLILTRRAHAYAAPTP